MVESVDTRDLKSLGHCGRVGSSPTSGTNIADNHLIIGNIFLWFHILFAPLRYLNFINHLNKYHYEENQFSISSIIVDARIVHYRNSVSTWRCGQNGKVNVADVVTLIDYLLTGTWDEPLPPDEPQPEIFTVGGVSFKMIPVEGGTFTMGATAEQGSDAYDWEKPAHEVTLSSYCIGEAEVTQALWQAVMGSSPSYFTGNLQRPVERVTWNDCQTFITKLSQLTGKTFRLPTEAEWEYAARGGNKSQGYKYAGSNTLGDVAWYDGNSSSTTHPVATKAPNELGLYDMSGNVWEWCQDWYGSYSSGAQTNPTGPTLGSARVYRGGSWYYYASSCRAVSSMGQRHSEFVPNLSSCRQRVND